jgi:hypothetical protein
VTPVAQLFDDAHRRAWIEAASKAYACDPREAIAKAAELVAMLEKNARGGRS